MLTVTNISKQFDNFCLKDISFNLDKGYILGLIGANGSGKTTLLNILCGLNDFDGKVTFEDYDLVKDSSFYKANVGLISSDNNHGFIKNLSIKDNANLFGRFYKTYDYSAFTSYATKLSLDIGKKLSICDISDITKFEFAFALSHKAKLLILDEPNGNFNNKDNLIFTNLLREYVNENMAYAIISTHQIKELNSIADYVTMINDGKLVFSYDVETLLDKYLLIKADNIAIHHFYKSDIINQESNEYSTSTLIKNNDRVKACLNNNLDLNLKVIRPQIEDIMYHLIKGGTTYE